MVPSSEKELKARLPLVARMGKSVSVRATACRGKSTCQLTLRTDSSERMPLAVMMDSSIASNR